MSTDLRQQTPSSPRPPSPWLPLSFSLVSLLLSAVTFYLVHANKGELELLLPDKVGIALKNGRLDLVVPITFTNTGAPRQGRQVLATSAEVQTTSSPPFVATTEWTYEVGFVHRLRFFKDFPEERARDHGEVDFIVYSNRAFPFQLNGATSLSKTYNFVQTSGQAPMRPLGEFQLTLRVRTERGDAIRSAKYRLLEAKLDNSYAWADASP